MILGLSGKALAGKDSTADYLLENYDFDRKIGFAYNLKAACVEIFNLTWDQVLTQDGKSADLDRPAIITRDLLLELIGWMRRTHDVALQYRPHFHLLDVKLNKPREILQFVGTEVMRYYASNYHCEVVFRSIKENENVIITDVRFPNEAFGILEGGGKLIRINRPLELRGLCDVSLNSNHPSEVALDEWGSWSYVLNNCGADLETLHTDIDKMVVSLGLNK